MDNTLPVGTARIGQLYDDAEDTPHIAAQLRRSPEGVHLEVSLLTGVTDHHAVWFKTMQVPSFLSFRDTSGSVALAGLRFESHEHSSAWGKLAESSQSARPLLVPGSRTTHRSMGSDPRSPAWLGGQACPR